MRNLESVLAGLNDPQREAALALRGPVAILAGAGTGKTTTITHRIACQVRSGAFDASQILAVTFTDKAAGELRRRLETLDVAGVEARTFHSAALSQLSRLWSSHTGEPLPEVLDHKAPLIVSLANALPPPHKFLPRRELANEIEWAKNRMITPARYLAELGDHDPPIPAELMVRVYEGYERRKRATGRLDFEDMLGLVVRLFDEHPEAADEVRAQWEAELAQTRAAVESLRIEAGLPQHPFEGRGVAEADVGRVPGEDEVAHDPARPEPGHPTVAGQAAGHHRQREGGESQRSEREPRELARQRDEIDEPVAGEREEGFAARGANSNPTLPSAARSNGDGCPAQANSRIPDSGSSTAASIVTNIPGSSSW